MYADCLINLNESEKAVELINSLDEDLLKNNDIQKILKRINLIKKQNLGPSVEELLKKLSESPKNIDLIIKISEAYFAENKFNESFGILLDNFPTNKEVIKKKMLHFFDVLGFENESVIMFRKKLASAMFA